MNVRLITVVAFGIAAIGYAMILFFLLGGGAP